ncbi:hypothetical protein SAMN05518683_1461, partial [Salibacterium halotolerans]
QAERGRRFAVYKNRGLKTAVFQNDREKLDAYLAEGYFFNLLFLW